MLSVSGQPLGMLRNKTNLPGHGRLLGQAGPSQRAQAAPGNAQTGFPLRASEFLEISSSVVPLSIYWTSSFFFFFFKASSSKFFALLFPRGSCLHLAGRELSWLNTDLGELKPGGFQSSLYLSLLLKILFLSVLPV